MKSLQVTDAQSRAVQKTPNRVSLDDIQSAIASEFMIEPGTLARMGFVGDAPVLTICLITMKNGFTVIGKSAPADPANFDPVLGCKFAREDAMRQIWPLMGFALRDKLLQRALDGLD